MLYPLGAVADGDIVNEPHETPNRKDKKSFAVTHVFTLSHAR